MRCLGTGNAYVEYDVASKSDTRSGYGCRGGGVGRALRGRMDRKGLGTVGGTSTGKPKWCMLFMLRRKLS